MRHVIVGTAGHIDHGKTALVGALTGIDTDRFKEEKERGITIDIGFANLDLDDGTRIGFVDVPGHERFVKNMLAGIGGIDLVMLVVAADESIMPQTREHLDICSLLQIQRGLAVITKTDAVETDLVDLVELEVREYLEDTFLHGAPVVRFSAKTGAGRDDLVRALGEVAAQVQVRSSDKVFRLPIDRCFTMKGFGTVVTGTLISGSIGKDDPVEVLPRGRETRVRGVQVHGRAVERAEAGQRTALNLQGVEVGEVERGMVLTARGLLEPTSMIDCHVELLSSAARPVTRRKRIRFHSGTAEVMGYVRILGQDRLEPGNSAFAQIHLEEETVLVPGDRFIIRQYSPMITIGGGEVLEIRARRHRLKDPRVLERLDRLRRSSMTERVMMMIDEHGSAGVARDDLVARLGLAPTRLGEHLGTLEGEGRIRYVSETPVRVVAAAAFQSVAERMLHAVHAFHEANPLATGISREELQQAGLEDASPVVFEAVLADLVAGRKLAASQELVHAYGRSVTLGAEDEALRTRIQTELRRFGLEVPPVQDLVRKLGLDPARARKIVTYMIRSGDLVKVNDELVADGPTVADLVSRLRERKKTDPRLGVGEFKEVTGVSRKYAIPFLEYLDRVRVTRRDGNERWIL